MRVLKFGAVWCPGCIIMKPIWEEMEAEMSELKTEYFDIDENSDMAKQWEVSDEIPVFIFLDKEGKEFARKKGQISKQELMDFIKENLEK